MIQPVDFIPDMVNRDTRKYFMFNTLSSDSRTSLKLLRAAGRIERISGVGIKIFLSCLNPELRIIMIGGGCVNNAPEYLGR